MNGEPVTFWTNSGKRTKEIFPEKGRIMHCHFLIWKMSGNLCVIHDILKITKLRGTRDISKVKVDLECLEGGVRENLIVNHSP